MDRDMQGLGAIGAKLLAAIKQRRARVGVIGLGHVGLPLSLAIGRAGFSVTGFDVDRIKVDGLNAGRSQFNHIDDDALRALCSAGAFAATCDFASLAEVDIALVCVPTPLTSTLEPDLGCVVDAMRRIADSLPAGKLVVLESTSYPGTAIDVCRPILEMSGLNSGRDFFLAFSPEREDPGNTRYNTCNVPKIVGGDGSQALDLAATFYGQFVEQVVRVSSMQTAEAVKITENVFRAVNIALANELKVIYQAMGIDIWEVIDAAKTKPFGYMPFYPGPGLGGHCIPVDPLYLTWKARSLRVPSTFIELAGLINASMPQRVVDELARALDSTQRIGLNGTPILVIGVGYKKNVDDVRESPGVRIIELLEQRNAKVDYYDPHVHSIGPAARERRSIDWDAAALGRYRAVVIATDHDAVNYAELGQNARLIIDTRNVCARAGVDRARVWKA